MTQPIHWWQRGVIYQIYPRSFMDSNGDGIGDLDGILQRLDYLNDGSQASLGVDAIWISPIFPSPMADFGYDVADYCDIDPMFGDMNAFDRLLAAAHRRGIKVLLDWVPNHTSTEHRWFKESRSSRDNPKRDWYIWRDPKPDPQGVLRNDLLPNNWGSFFGGPAWTLDPLTGQYYLHQFDPGQPELNWRNPQVRAAMLDTLRFWLDRGLDGFRMDVIGLLIKDKDLRDNPPNPQAPANLRPNDIHGRQLHIYTEDQDEVHEIIREIRKLFDGYEERVSIGELWGPLDRWVRYYGAPSGSGTPKGSEGDELHLPFNFRLMWMPWQAQAMRRCVDELEGAIPSFGWPNYVLGNHDQIRLATRFGGQEPARLAGMLLLTLRGTPTLYYGDELGLENGIIPPEKVQDPQGINLGAERTRDVSRTPMQWDASPNAGFSQAEPWLPVSADYAHRNVAVQSQEPFSMVNFYRRMIWLRRGSPALSEGSYRDIDSDPDCFVFVREAQGERRLVALNFANEPHRIDVSAAASPTPAQATGRVLISTHLDREGRTLLSTLDLRPNEGVVIEL